MDRRSFLAAAAASSASLALPGNAHAAKSKVHAPETLVTQLFKSLNDKQRKEICFDFDHPLRLKVNNNWHITKPRLGSSYTPDQQALVKDIFMGIHSEQYAKTVYNQVVHDSGKAGFADCSIALFGNPGTGKFEFVLTGRHCTRRCDGDSVEGSAFGGPIFYGHAAQGFVEKPNHPGNAYWYQAKKANEVFEMLNGKQRKIALLDEARDEEATKTVELTGKKQGLEGIPMTELTPDQKGKVRDTIKDILAPYRKKDSSEAIKLIDKAGFDHLHMAFFEKADVGNDRVWDVWQIEGPSMVCFFRGDPHVHAWIHIRENA
ncbi:MAG: DUF3500 domain-containing protein [Verrucomicrobiaceae bacterium]|nr:DUF3500 domain-containing protein [Verrucomicrobiaceae bacterium]